MTSAVGNRGRAKRLCTVAAAWLLLGSACGGSEQSPEARLRTLVEEAEAAAEAHDFSTLSDKLSGDYRDRRGYDRRAVLRLVQGVLLSNRRIHLLSVVRELAVQGDSARWPAGRSNPRRPCWTCGRT